MLLNTKQINIIVVPEVRFSWRVKRALENLSIWDSEGARQSCVAGFRIIRKSNAPASQLLRFPNFSHDDWIHTFPTQKFFRY